NGSSLTLVLVPVSPACSSPSVSVSFTPPSNASGACTPPDAFGFNLNEAAILSTAVTGTIAEPDTDAGTPPHSNVARFGPEAGLRASPTTGLAGGSFSLMKSRLPCRVAVGISPGPPGLL